jgi:hypothetical protein
MAIAVFCLPRVVPPAFWASLRSRVDPGEWKKQNWSSPQAYALQGLPSFFRYAHFGWLCTSGLQLDYLGNTGVASNLCSASGLERRRHPREGWTLARDQRKPSSATNKLK